jgi:hypothetical protein
MSIKAKWWIFVLVPLAIIVGLSGLQHFIYDWLPNPFFATFAPISESVWEHLKIVFYPFVFVWIASYLIFRRSLKLGWREMLFAVAIGATTACVLTVFLFYLIHSGFGIVQSSWVDIGIEIISLFVAQMVAWHIAKNTRHISPIISILILFVWIVSFIVFSFIIPTAPMFVG